jgi:hypothetical protein
MSRELQEGVIANAVTLASDSDPEIIAQDRRSIIFCAIQELEQTLLKSDEASFMRTLSAACERRFKGWHLSSVHQEVNGPKAERKDFPFDLCDVLPWWAETDRVLHREPQE